MFKVKGLSIEHEKLAVAQSHSSGMDTSLELPTSRKQLKMLKEEQEGGGGGGGGSNASSSNPSQHQQHQSSPSPSYSPAMSPYLQHPHYRQYEQHLGSSGSGGGGGGSLRSLRSPNEMLQESLRESVLRDGSKQGGRPGSPEPLSMYR